MKHTGVAVSRLAVALATATALVVLNLAGWASPRTALADPSADPCPLEIAFVCNFLPIAPELDDDVDLTKPPPSEPGAPER